METIPTTTWNSVGKRKPPDFGAPLLHLSYSVSMTHSIRILWKSSPEIDCALLAWLPDRRNRPVLDHLPARFGSCLTKPASVGFSIDWGAVFRDGDGSDPAGIWMFRAEWTQTVVRFR